MLPINSLNSVSRKTFTSVNNNKVAASRELSVEDNLILEDEFKKSNEKMSENKKQKIIYKARTKAAGWSILGGIMSTLYYYLRSDETIADKYDLDKEKDKKFIEELRTKQTIATIPGAVGAGIIGWIAFKFFAKPESK